MGNVHECYGWRMRMRMMQANIEARWYEIGECLECGRMRLLRGIDAIQQDNTRVVQPTEPEYEKALGEFESIIAQVRSQQ